MEVSEFNSLFLNTLTEKLLSEKNKEVFLLGDFTIDLLKYEKDHNAADFLDQMYSTSFPVGIYLLKVNYRNTRTRCEICSNLTIKTPERRQ